MLAYISHKKFFPAVLKMYRTMKSKPMCRTNQDFAYRYTPNICSQRSSVATSCDITLQN
uniref:Uncharacterized protein n=1 Tax=Anguilla anguilla TaxID=7936 RepID=A0A0E9VE09_ANGAN